MADPASRDPAPRADSKAPPERARATIVRDGSFVRLQGELSIDDAARVWPDLRAAAAEAAEEGAVHLDLSRASSIDGAMMALVGQLRAELAASGVEADITGAKDRVAALAELYAGGEAERPKRRRPESAIAQVGGFALEVASEVRAMLSFVGELAVAVAKAVRRPRSANFGEVPSLIERCGSEAVFIVALIDFLVGFVTAYQAARQLRLYGANVYVADLVGISLTRELAPLMTAIIVCGRSGAAFAAEIGSMQVSEEIDALRTLGLAPFGWLVVPRVLALVIVTPILTLFADFVGVAGGGIVAVTSLDQTFRGYLTETQTAVELWDVGSGLLKSVAFALAIATIACQQGFAASGGPEGVGKRTTRTVVVSLFALVVIDAVLTVVFRLFDPQS